MVYQTRSPRRLSVIDAMRLPVGARCQTPLQQTSAVGQISSSEHTVDSRLYVCASGLICPHHPRFGGFQCRLTHVTVISWRRARDAKILAVWPASADTSCYSRPIGDHRNRSSDAGRCCRRLFRAKAVTHWCKGPAWMALIYGLGPLAKAINTWIAGDISDRAALKAVDLQQGRLQYQRTHPGASLDASVRAYTNATQKTPQPTPQVT
jgi:hypothetical protein